MKIVQLDRQRGKTTGCIAWLCENPGNYLLTFDLQEERRLKKRYPTVADRIMTFDRARSGGLLGRTGVAVAIDNIDILLSGLLQLRIEMVTCS